MTPQTVLLLGATGTIGRATGRAIEQAGHTVIAPVRRIDETLPRSVQTLDPIEIAIKNTKPHSIISCLASRNGLDAWDVDYALNSTALKAARAAGTERFILLSAICVQKPRLTFQHAKLAFEAELRASPLIWSIVRPTAFFKSLSGQVARLKAGKPFLVFGPGDLTACKPISDRDTANYLTRCLIDPALANRTLPIGGPGPAFTPLDQGTLLFDALGLTPRFRHVSPALLSTIAAALKPIGTLSPKAAEKSELARIGHYYATESMLVWNPTTQRYDANATPETGTDRLADHYAALASGTHTDDRGAHAVF